MPVIPATQEAEIERIVVRGQLGQKICKILSQPKKKKTGYGGVHQTPSLVGIVSRRVEIQAKQGMNARSYRKNS
jgi:hypothetical protein